MYVEKTTIAHKNIVDYVKVNNMGENGMIQIFSSNNQRKFLEFLSETKSEKILSKARDLASGL
jgi:hypothetical protein